MTLTCGGCNKEVKRGNKLLINCSKCRKTFHNTCVSYQSSTSLSPKFNEEWICPDCSAKSKRGGDNSNTPIKPVISRDETSNELHSPDGVCSQGSAHIDDIISSLKKELPKLIREQLVVVITPLETLVRDLQASVTFLSDKYDDFSARMDKLVADSDRHDKIITQNTDELQKLNYKISTLEQQLRDCNIEIHGVGESKTENLYNILQKIADSVSCSLNENDIIKVTRVATFNKDSKKPRTIIAKFTNPRRRDEFISSVSRYNKSNPNNKISTSIMGLPGQNAPIYIAEHLSPANKALHSAARLKAKEMKYKFVWVRDGHIYVRKDENSRYILIKSKQSLDKIA